MPNILVRDIEDDVKERLRRRANRHGRSMEAEVRDILRDAVKSEDDSGESFSAEIAALFKGIGLRPDEEIVELRAIALKDPFSA